MTKLFSFLLQLPLYAILLAGIQSYFPEWNDFEICGFGLLILIAYTTGDFLGREADSEP